MDTVRGWVRNGLIQPSPIKDGREYLVEECAVKVNSINEVSHKSMLLQRIGHDQNQKNKKSGFAP
ncbi:excisionase [Arsenophonus apicola]|uniref:excisionase n=1 Tax=Arsenophonus apicola TaxID=2879119 RepID=UPI003879157A